MMGASELRITDGASRLMVTEDASLLLPPEPAAPAMTPALAHAKPRREPVSKTRRDDGGENRMESLRDVRSTYLVVAKQLEIGSAMAGMSANL
jgi:hypothetical protein